MVCCLSYAPHPPESTGLLHELPRCRVLCLNPLLGRQDRAGGGRHRSVSGLQTFLGVLHPFRGLLVSCLCCLQLLLEAADTRLRILSCLGCAFQLSVPCPRELPRPILISTGTASGGVSVSELPARLHRRAS